MNELSILFLGITWERETTMPGTPNPKQVLVRNVPKPEEEGVPSVAAMLADAQLSLEQHYKTKIKDVAHIAVLSNVAVIGYD